MIKDMLKLISLYVEIKRNRYAAKPTVTKTAWPARPYGSVKYLEDI